MPRASIQAVLRRVGVPGDKLAAVLVATRDATYAEGVGSELKVPLLWRVSRAIPPPAPLGRKLRDSFAAARRRRIDEAVRSEFGVACPVVYVDHHLAHAAGATLGLGLRDCVCVTVDGGADGSWAAVTAFSGGKARRVAGEIPGLSLSAFLEAVCEELDISEGIDRYARLEELAAHGVSVHFDGFDKAVRTENGRFRFDARLLRAGGIAARTRSNARREDVAASALAVAADHLRRWVTHWYVRTDPRALVLAGDAFELPTLVRAVLDAPEIPGARLAALPGDTGLPIGAALAACLPGILPAPMPAPEGRMPSLFLGPSYTDAEIEAVLAREGATYRHHPHIERDIARVLAEGRSVARFDGPSEVGNRTLGNRVLLRNPTASLRRGRVGDVHGPAACHALVCEESFGALFCDERADVGDLRHHPVYVTPTDESAARFPQLVGWGRRIRVQTVARESSPGLHDILREFQSWTGLPLLAAAPFRLANEPLVSSPLDAVRTFRLLGADHAALGRFLVQSTREPASPEEPSATVASRAGRDRTPR
ncbi:MAG: carbamoyltransferase C-terminal domain-containing protein [bacterium]